MPGAATSKQETNTQTQQKVAPWDPQASALSQAFTNAQGAYGTASQAKAPTDFTAGLTPDQVNLFKQMVGYGTDTGVPNAEASAGSTLLNAGTSGATDALTRLGAFDPSATNNMGAITSGANQYVQGVDIPGQVKQAMQSAVETARDVTNPMGVNAAATTGNTNSSRTGAGGIAEGIVNRGLAEQAGNLSSTLSNQAYQTGAGLSANAASQNTSEKLNAIVQALSGGNSLAGTGASTASNSTTDAGNLFSIANAGGTGQQAGNQANLTNELQQYQSGVSSPYDALNGLMQIIGSQNWGSNSSGTSNSLTKTTPSALSIIGGLMSAGGSAAKLAAL